MITSLNRRRILIYLLLAFGLTWGLDFIVYRNGGLENSPPLVDGVPISQALALITLSMWGPALANLITRAVTKEGRRDLWLRPHFRQGWPYWLLMWFLPAALSVLGAALYFGLFPANFDPTMRGFQAQMAEATGQAVDLPGSAMIALGFTQAVLLAPLLNALAVFGEEFGWRAYLQPKLMPLGARKTMLIMGVIWGVWHWPVIAMGYNYGVDYPGYPWLGPLAMVWFTMMVGTVLGWSVLRGEERLAGGHRPWRAQRHCRGRRTLHHGNAQYTPGTIARRSHRRDWVDRDGADSVVADGIRCSCLRGP